MAEQQTLADLKNVIEGTVPAEGGAAATETAPLPEPKIDNLGRAYGKITVNGRDQEVYFARPVLRLIIAQAFEVADRVDGYDVVCTVKGGGLSTVRRKPVRASSSRSVKDYDTYIGLLQDASGNRGVFLFEVMR